jgi:hypothetical protein
VVEWRIGDFNACWRTWIHAFSSRTSYCIAFCYVDDMCFSYRDQGFDDIIESFEADSDKYNWELTVKEEVTICSWALI